VGWTGRGATKKAPDWSGAQSMRKSSPHEALDDCEPISDFFG
jgi:hypothetical protein